MKKYKVAGKSKKDLLLKVSKKLNIALDRIAHKVLSETAEKVILEVWVKPAAKNKKKYQLDIDKEAGVFLTVIDPSKDINDLINYIAEKDIEAPEMSQIYTAYENPGTRTKIAEYYEGIYVPSIVDLEVSEDKMEVKAFFTEPRGMEMPTVQEIVMKLNEAGITFGASLELINEALSSNKFNVPLLIAKGKEPEKGNDAEIKYHVNVLEKKSRLKPAVLQDGSVDFKNLDLIENVSAGRLLAEKIDAEKGRNGKNVFGEELTAKDGKDIVFRGGKNTELSEDGRKLTAKIDGMVSFSEKKISVLNVFTALGCGITTGNINFLGGVQIRGDVDPGYTIEAEGNIEIKGNVEKANLISKSDVIVRGSIFGKETGKVIADNDIIINFAEASILESGGNIVANEAIMNSKVYSEGKIRVIDQKGVILGGVLKAAEGIEAINIGSHVAVKTDIEVGSNPKIIEKIRISEEELKTLDKKIEQIEKNILLLQKLKAKLKDQMPEDKIALFSQLVNAKFTMARQKSELVHALDEYEAKASDVKNATVDVYGVCYPGVKIKIRKGSYHVKEKIHNVRFYYEKGDVRITALK